MPIRILKLRGKVIPEDRVGAKRLRIETCLVAQSVSRQTRLSNVRVRDKGTEAGGFAFSNSLDTSQIIRSFDAGETSHLKEWELTALQPIYLK